MSDDFWKMKHVYAQMNGSATSQAAERKTAATTRVFVALLNEGTEVWRPVEAKPLGGQKYEILGPVPTEEVWQFQPGAQVLCQEKTFADGTKGLVACEGVAP
jgi:hypothetical protein